MAHCCQPLQNGVRKLFKIVLTESHLVNILILAPCSYFVYKETLREMRIIKNEKKYSTSIKFYDSPGK